jgi:hypothetical protein
MYPATILGLVEADEGVVRIIEIAKIDARLVEQFGGDRVHGEDPGRNAEQRNIDNARFTGSRATKQRGSDTRSNRH